MHCVAMYIMPPIGGTLPFRTELWGLDCFAAARKDILGSGLLHDVRNRVVAKWSFLSIFIVNNTANKIESLPKSFEFITIAFCYYFKPFYAPNYVFYFHS